MCCVSSAPKSAAPRHLSLWHSNACTALSGGTYIIFLALRGRCHRSQCINYRATDCSCLNTADWCGRVLSAGIGHTFYAIVVVSCVCESKKLTYSNACVQKLPLTVVDLAEQSPSITGDGSPVLGERSSSVYYIHRRTGKLLSTFQSPGAPPQPGSLNSTRPHSPNEGPGVGVGVGVGVGAHDAAGGVEDEWGEGGHEEVSLWNMHAADVVAVGRVTYLVEAKHALTRETLWNMTFSRWQHMPLPGGEFVEASLLNVGEGVPCLRCIF